MKRSDLLIVLAAAALVNPCFFKNKVNTALASSFSAASKFGGTTLKLNDPSYFALYEKSLQGNESCFLVTEIDDLEKEESFKERTRAEASMFIHSQIHCI